LNVCQRPGSRAWGSTSLPSNVQAPAEADLAPVERPLGRDADPGGGGHEELDLVLGRQDLRGAGVGALAADPAEFVAGGGDRRAVTAAKL